MSQIRSCLDIALNIARKRAGQLKAENPDCDIEIQKVILTVDDITLENKWGYAILRRGKDGRNQLIEFVENEYTWEKNWESIYRETAEKGIDFRVLVPEFVREIVCKNYPIISSQLLCYDDKGRIMDHSQLKSYKDSQSWS